MSSLPLQSLTPSSTDTNRYFSGTNLDGNVTYVAASDNNITESDTDVAVDTGVERLLGLMWLFRHRGRIRTNDDIEVYGYPDLTAEGSAGRKNFFNDRERLQALGITLEPVDDQHGWAVTNEADPVMLVLTPTERNAITEARLLLADNDDLPIGHTGARPHGTVPAAVPVVLAAISDHHPLHFTYGDKARTIDPHRVVVTSTDRWYVLGIDHSTGVAATRTFRIDRITAAHADRDHTTAPLPLGAQWPLHPTAWSSDPSVLTTVMFPHQPLPEWLAILGNPHSMHAYDNGTVEATFEVSSHHAFVRRTLAVGACITDPTTMVDLAESTLSAHIAAYGPL